MNNFIHHLLVTEARSIQRRRDAAHPAAFLGVLGLLISTLLLTGCSSAIMPQQPVADAAIETSASASAAPIASGPAITGTGLITGSVSAEPVVALLAATVAPTPARKAVHLPTPTPIVVATEPSDAEAPPSTPRREAQIIESLVNARRAPALDAEIVTLVEVGSRFEIVDASADGEWLQICCVGDNDEAAWVSTALVEEVQAVAMAETSSSAVADDGVEQPAPAADGYPVGLINAALVNLRGGPGTGYPVVGGANDGERYQLTGRTEDASWLQICCVDGQVDGELGWISADFIDAIASEPLNSALAIVAAPPIPEPAVVVASTGGGGDQAAQQAAAPAPGLPGDGGFGQPGGTNPLTGLPLDGGRAGQRPVIVCINNDYAARPQFGISQADVMYEYLMEGFGITRFSGVFYGDSVGQIGPVRSARLINYYMAPLYKAGLACSGASDGVRYALKHEMPAPYMDIDLDDPSNNRYSVSIGSDYRTRLRMGTDGLRRWLAEWGVEQPASIRGFTFGGAPGGGQPATSVSIPYPRATGSQVGYQYDAGSGRYLRSLGGGPHLDGNSGAQVGVENVVVQYIPHEITDIVEDSLGSRSIRLNLFGSGRAVVFRDGQAFTGVWRSDSQGDTPRFYADDGSEIPLKPGHTWVSVAPLDYGVEYQ